MFKKIAIIFSLLFASYSLSADNTIQVFETLLHEKSTQIKTIVCDFKQVRSSAIFAQDDVKTGKFTYKRPDSILLAFKDGDYIMMTQTNFSIRNAGVVADVKVGANPMLKELKRLLSACMTGDVKSMSASFTINITETEGSYIVKLTPIKGRGSAKMDSVTMCFDKADMSLSELKLLEPSGDSIAYEFYNKKFNVEVSDETFVR